MRKNGFSLLEVMVSMLIAGLALLGLAATQLKSLQFANNSFDYTISLIQGQNAIERLWVRLCDVQTNNIDVTSDAFMAQLKPAQSIAYRYDLKKIAVNKSNKNDMTFTVSWVDKRTIQSGETHYDIADQVSLNTSYIQLYIPATPSTPVNGCTVL
ncbi:type IV pilus modification PilV family protein [Pseudoalteromonas citrea]|nr:prepilin-type N-terminal cleavage/methylation domain-containing protein [Pseudoalteromonas citrea]